MNGWFVGKCAIVTGAASGICRVILQSFVRQGGNGELRLHSAFFEYCPARLSLPMFWRRAARLDRRRFRHQFPYLSSRKEILLMRVLYILKGKIKIEAL